MIVPIWPFVKPNSSLIALIRDREVIPAHVKGGVEQADEAPVQTAARPKAGWVLNHIVAHKARAAERMREAGFLPRGKSRAVIRVGGHFSGRMPKSPSEEKGASVCAEIFYCRAIFCSTAMPATGYDGSGRTFMQQFSSLGKKMQNCLATKESTRYNLRRQKLMSLPPLNSRMTSRSVRLRRE